MQLEGFKDLTRIEQTLFGLPLVLAGAFLPLWTLWGRAPIAWGGLVWTLPAFALARISGMAFNQLIDRKIDAQNPRTRHRALPTGRVSAAQARMIAWGALGGFIVACTQINTLCAWLAPCAGGLLFFYSYSKRMHAGCHFVLGLIHFLSPFMAACAVYGGFYPPALWLGLAAFFMIAANDIVYAIQDYAFDCAHCLHSIPVRWGVKASLHIARALHVAGGLCLAFLGLALPISWMYYLLLPCVGGVWLYFHTQVYVQVAKTGSVRGIESLFFFSTSMASGLILLFLVVGMVWRA